jgi:hypothetical protein
VFPVTCELNFYMLLEEIQSLKCQARETRWDMSNMCVALMPRLHPKPYFADTPVLHQSPRFSESIMIINLANVFLHEGFSFPCPVFISRQLGTGLLLPLFNTCMQGVSVAVPSGVCPYCTCGSDPCWCSRGCSFVSASSFGNTPLRILKIFHRFD